MSRYPKQRFSSKLKNLQLGLNNQFFTTARAVSNASIRAVLLYRNMLRKKYYSVL